MTRLVLYCRCPKCQLTFASEFHTYQIPPRLGSAHKVICAACNSAKAAPERQKEYYEILRKTEIDPSARG